MVQSFLVELGWVGLGWVGLGWVGLGCVSDRCYFAPRFGNVQSFIVCILLRVYGYMLSLVKVMVVRY